MVFSTQASAFIVTYPVDNAIDKKGNETKKAVAWEKAFIQLVKVFTLTYILSISGKAVMFLLVMVLCIQLYLAVVFWSYLLPFC